MNTTYPVASQAAHPPPVGSPVETACGARIRYHAEVPYVLVKGNPVYFCLPLCKEDFEKEPRFSCLSNREQAEDQ